MPYKNSEKRKEKSRDAARHRRGKESEVFNELAQCLPMTASAVSQLDKASIMRLSISYLKIQQILNLHQWSDEGKKAGVNDMLDHLFPKALDGFVFILSQEGDIIYINDSVVKHLGIQQIELMGQSIYDFCDPRDEDEIREAVSVRPHGTKHAYADKEDRVFFIRLKCTLTSKGRNVNLKSASHKVIRCKGHMVVPSDARQGGCFPYLLCVGEPVPHPANIEVPLGRNTFLTKHDMDLKFTYCDDRVRELLKYGAEDLMGRSLLDYHHAGDSHVVDGAYKDLLGKGQTVTGHYRFLVQGGGWVWMMTQATVIHSPRNSKAQWLVCVHHVLSEVEQKGVVLSEVQKVGLRDVCREEGEAPRRMMPCTESIFAPKTADMDQGYFIPPHMRNTIKMAKSNEPEDLSYLAPMAGDVGMPLQPPISWTGVEMPPCGSSSVRREDVDLTLTCPPTPSSCLMLQGLKQEPGLSPTTSTLGHPPRCHEPGLSPTSSTLGHPPRCQDWHTAQSSPSSSSVSPSSCSSAGSSRMSSPRDYMCGPSPHSTQMMAQFFTSLNMKVEAPKEDRDVQCLDEIDRAPYIPMSNAEDQQAHPPSKEAIYSVQKDVNPALQGKTEYVFHSKQDSNIFEEPPAPPRPSLRDMIEGSTAVASIEQPTDTMFLQLKRPLDMNSLEKGPPASKVLCRPAGGQEGGSVARHSLLCRPAGGQEGGSVARHSLQQLQQQQNHRQQFQHQQIRQHQQHRQQQQHHQLQQHRQRQQQQQQNIGMSPQPATQQLQQQQQQQQQQLRQQQLRQQFSQAIAGRGQRMLLNLLLTGEDSSGYRTTPLGPRTHLTKVGVNTTSSGPPMSLNPLSSLTQHDCDVNIPIQCGPLLDGDDLLTALDMPSTPHHLAAPPLH